MPGLIGAGQAYNTAINQQAQQLSTLAQDRKNANDQMKAQENQETMGSVAMGASIGGMAFGPLGALGGAALGYAFGELL